MIRGRWPHDPRPHDPPVGIVAAIVKSQEGWILQGEHGEGGHQGVAKGYFGVTGARVGKGFKTGADRLEKGVGGEHFACLPGGGGGNHGQILLPECESGQTSEEFCHGALRRGSSEGPIFHSETQRPGIADDLEGFSTSVVKMYTYVHYFLEIRRRRWDSGDLLDDLVFGIMIAAGLEWNLESQNLVGLRDSKTVMSQRVALITKFLGDFLL